MATEGPATATPPVPILSRARLLAALDEGAGHDVTVVCAPAGFGKTVLLGDHARHALAPPAWAGLEEGDGDPRRFWTAVLAGLHACPAVPPESRLHRMPVSRCTVEDDFVADVLAALDALPERVDLVLDDVHHLRDTAALRGLLALLRTPRPRLRIILATRHEGGLPLARMRLEERLHELRAEALLFTARETAALLARHRLRPAPAEVAVLHARTGGWAAGLRLAADRAGRDGAAALRAFSGDDPAVAEYLDTEVLSHLDRRERDVLRRVSVADPLPAPLAVELAGRDDAAEVLDALEHGTGLVAPGPGRTTYRLQPMLRDHLLADLDRSEPAHLAALRARAARWWSARGEPAPALAHAAEAGDAALLTGLLRRWTAELAARGEHGTLARALGAVDAAPATEALSAVVAAQVALRAGDRAAVRAALGAAAVDEDLRPLWTATARLALLDGAAEDVPGAEPVDPASAALVLAGRAARSLAGGAHAAARPAATGALAVARARRYRLLEVQCLVLLSAVAWVEGDHRAAAAAAAAAAGRGEHGAWTAAACGLQAHAALARARPAEALRLAERGLHHGAGHTDPARHVHDPALRFALRSARAAALADLHGAARGLPAMQDARAQLAGAALPGPLAAAAALLECRTALRAGHRTAGAGVIAWLAQRGTGGAERALMLGWLRAADGDWRAVRECVAALPAGQAQADPGAVAVEAPLLAAAASLAVRDRIGARRHVQAALAAGEPGDVLRPFALAGPEVGALLVDQLGGRDPGSFVHRALACRRRPGSTRGVPLSGRERDVLDRLPILRNLDEIAEDLDVSINTVKTHMRAIYGKLGVASRRDAVLAAHERGLLATLPATRPG